MRYTPQGIAVARFTMAINRPPAGRAGPPASGANAAENSGNDVDFIPCVAWRRLAEICGEFLKKGRPVAVEGRLQLRPYEKDGQKRIFSEVIVDNMQMLGRRPEEPAAGGESEPVTEVAPAPVEREEEEIPF